MIEKIAVWLRFLFAQYIVLFLLKNSVNYSKGGKISIYRLLVGMEAEKWNKN